MFAARAAGDATTTSEIVRRALIIPHIAVKIAWQITFLVTDPELRRTDNTDMEGKDVIIRAPFKP